MDRSSCGYWKFENYGKGWDATWKTNIDRDFSKLHEILVILGVILDKNGRIYQILLSNRKGR